MCLVYNKDNVNLIIILGESDITITNYVNNCNCNKCCVMILVNVVNNSFYNVLYPQLFKL